MYRLQIEKSKKDFSHVSDTLYKQQNNPQICKSMHYM